MMRHLIKPLAIIALCCVSFAATAATWDVAVLNNRFEPNDITIQVGDTVRWTNNSGRTHNVVADDGSWSSPTSSSFVYEHTFDSIEEVFYYCSVHSVPGRDINSAMNGRVNVTAAEAGFTINPGISDAWFNRQTGGQGFFIIVWEDIQTVFLSWFTYDTERPPEDVTAILGEPGHRWLTAQGPYDGDTAVLNVTLTSGGVFDSAEPPATNDPDPLGTITVAWAGCNEGLLTYDLPALGLAGEIPIERIVLANVAACESAQQPAR